MTLRIIAFYAGLVYDTYDRVPDRSTLPDGVLMHAVDVRLAFGPDGWYRRDLTPVPLEDVPPQLRLLALLLD